MSRVKCIIKIKNKLKKYIYKNKFFKIQKLYKIKVIFKFFNFYKTLDTWHDFIKPTSTCVKPSKIRKWIRQVKIVWICILRGNVLVNPSVYISFIRSISYTSIKVLECEILRTATINAYEA
jgi:hypothetical protein